MADTKMVSVLIPVEWYEAATRAMASEKRSRNFILNRWMRWGVIREFKDDLLVEFPSSGVVGSPSNGPVSDFEVEADTVMARLGENLKAQTERGERFVLDDMKVFGTNVVGFTGEPNTQKRAETGISEEPPKVPDAAFVHLKLLNETIDRMSGADPAVLAGEQKGARTEAGMAGGGDLASEVPGAPFVNKELLKEPKKPKNWRDIKHKFSPEEHAEIKAEAKVAVSQIEKKIGEKCPHEWANWLQCPECNPKAVGEEF